MPSVFSHLQPKTIKTAGRVYPDKSKKKREKHHWPQSYFECPRPTWCSHHNRRCNHAEWGLPPLCLAPLDRLHNIIITAEDKMDAEQMTYIVIWECIFSQICSGLKLPSLTPLRMGGGRFTISGPLSDTPLFKPWRRPVNKMMQGLRILPLLSCDRGHSLILQMDADAILHEFIFAGEGWVYPDKSKKKREKRHWPQSYFECPGPTWWSHHNNGVLHRHVNFGPYNTAHILTFLDRRHNIVTAEDKMDAEQMTYIVIRDNDIFPPNCAGLKLVSSAATIFTPVPPPPYTPFLNSIETFFFGMAVEGLRSPNAWMY
ncbi:hypothetical protein N1851_033290 [Merluccius polli]|uniref:Uncharacterized protein n=1 Tax=Merluccius polli TaxID=89951 RepID=A0AA47M1J8_MERPO|nr:hypothetical protein N1851_033290 [Merluccius polli]